MSENIEKEKLYFILFIPKLGDKVQYYYNGDTRDLKISSSENFITEITQEFGWSFIHYIKECLQNKDAYFLLNCEDFNITFLPQEISNHLHTNMELLFNEFKSIKDNRDDTSKVDLNKLTYINREDARGITLKIPTFKY